MKLIVTAIFFAFVGAALGTPMRQLVGSNHCTWGPSYWCQHIDAAKECQAVEHCISVWKSNTPAQLALKNDKKCTFCTSFVNDLKQMMDNGKTKAEMTVLAKLACNLAPNPEMTALCQTAISHYLPEILNMVEQKLNASQICSALGLCAGFSTRQELTKVPLLLRGVPISAPRPGSLAQLLPKSKLGVANCDECKAMVAQIQSVLNNNATAPQVENILKTYLCSELGELQAVCNQYVDQYVPEVLQLLAQNLDPTSVCQMLGFCSKNFKKVAATRHAFLKTVFGRQLMKPMPKASPAECEVCELVVTEARSMLRDNKTDTEIEDFLRDRLCSHLGSYKTQCQAYVTQFAPTIIQLLVSELNPTVVCQALGACGQSRHRAVAAAAAPRPLVVKRVQSKSAAVQANSPQCIICEYVLSYLEGQLVSNRSEAAIEAALDKVCSVLPSTVSQECTAFVQQYGPTVIKLLVAEISPSRICTALGLCSAQQLRNGPQCTLCEFVVQTLDKQIVSNRSEAAIEAGLLKVCSVLPSSIRTECDAFVNQYGPAVIQLLVAQISPAKVCTTLGLCSAQRSPPSSSVLFFKPGAIKTAVPSRRRHARLSANGELCQVCQVVMEYADALLKENATIQDIEHVLEKVCNFLPNADSQACNSIIESYLPQIVQLIVAEFNPQQICSTIGLCAANKTQKMVYGRVHLIRNRLIRTRN